MHYLEGLQTALATKTLNMLILAKYPSIFVSLSKKLTTDIVITHMCVRRQNFFHQNSHFPEKPSLSIPVCPLLKIQCLTQEIHFMFKGQTETLEKLFSFLPKFPNITLILVNSLIKQRRNTRIQPAVYITAQKL